MNPLNDSIQKNTYIHLCCQIKQIKAYDNFNHVPFFLISFSTSYHFSNSNEALMVAAASLQQTSSNIFKSLETNKFIRILAYLLMLRNVVAFATPKTYSHIMLIKNCFGTLNLKSFGSSTQMKKQILSCILMLA